MSNKFENVFYLLIRCNFFLAFYGSKTDNAHPPIHPMGVPKGFLGGVEKDIYELVCRHFLANISADAIGEEQSIEISVETGENEAYTFTGKCNYLVEPGYLDVYKYQKWHGEMTPGFAEFVNWFRPKLNKNSGEIFIPKFQLKLTQDENWTEPEPLLAEADVIKLMDQNNIGTDATHSDHIEKIKDREYVKLDENGKFIPTILGLSLYHGYKNIYEDLDKFDSLREAPSRSSSDRSPTSSSSKKSVACQILKYFHRHELRCNLEQDLSKIAQGQKTKSEVLDNYIKIYFEAFKKCGENFRGINHAFDFGLKQSDGILGQLAPINPGQNLAESKHFDPENDEETTADGTPLPPKGFGSKRSRKRHLTESEKSVKEISAKKLAEQISSEATGYACKNYDENYRNPVLNSRKRHFGDVVGSASKKPKLDGIAPLAGQSFIKTWQESENPFHDFNPNEFTPNESLKVNYDPEEKNIVEKLTELATEKSLSAPFFDLQLDKITGKVTCTCLIENSEYQPVKITDDSEFLAKHESARIMFDRVNFDANVEELVAVTNVEEIDQDDSSIFLPSQKVLEKNLERRKGRRRRAEERRLGLGQDVAWQDWGGTLEPNLAFQKGNSAENPNQAQNANLQIQRMSIKNISNAVGFLQEMHAKNQKKYTPPKYEEVKSKQPFCFEIKCNFNNLEAIGIGNNKKDAKNNAACLIAEQLGHEIEKFGEKFFEKSINKQI